MPIYKNKSMIKAFLKYLKEDIRHNSFQHWLLDNNPSEYKRWEMLKNEQH